MHNRYNYIRFKFINKITEITRGRLMKNGFLSYERIAAEGSSWGLLCGDKKCVSAIDGNRQIFNMLNGSDPCMIARIGTTECGTIDAYIRKSLGLKVDYNHHIGLLCRDSGFFPADEAKGDCFCELYIDSFQQIDLIGTFGGHKEDYLIDKYMPNVSVMQYTALEPYYFQKPWTQALRNKKVLVIHPFSETIESQYKKRESLFENKEVLPEFELHTIKAVQSVAGTNTNFNDWFEALDYMKKQIAQMDFDIAIIGCGAYGLPLASYVKSLGKKSILTAGATQILFGIKGKRWNDHPVISKFYNEFWVVPTAADRPVNAEKVEGGCYW